MKKTNAVIQKFTVGGASNFNWPLPVSSAGGQWFSQGTKTFLTELLFQKLSTRQSNQTYKFVLTAGQFFLVHHPKSPWSLENNNQTTSIDGESQYLLNKIYSKHQKLLDIYYKLLL